MASSVPEPAKDHRLIAGVVVVAVLLTGGRWISHMRVGPLYIGDLLLGAAFLHAVLLRALPGKRSDRVYGPGILVGLLLAVAALRLLGTEDDVRTAARDAAPFAYAAIAYLSAGAYQRVGEGGRRRTVRMIHGGLLLHLAWMIVATLAPRFVATLPEVGNTRVFEIRTDFDVAVLGVLAGLSILRIRRGRVWLHGSVAIAALVTGFAQVNRAGLLSCAACVLVAVVLRAGGNGRLTARAVLLGATAVLAVAVVLPMSPAGQRLLALNAPSASSSQIVENAQGTKRARLIAWQQVVTYTLDDPERTTIGVGFGPDFLQLSNGDLPIGRGIGVRSPHNYLVTCFARLGLVGLAVVLALLVRLLTVSLRIVRRGPPDALTSLCVLLVVSLLIAALLGVILESPFGATPFFWAAGILLGGDRSRRARTRREPEPQTHVSSPQEVLV
ncbi:O-antigen ligase family protein [Streptomyces griseorubiginosus]|uniref:O-antigen ligase family protein n=1 Tax=Streptomyces griseorubiginosus TaxID=67304 RepID=UPI0033B47AAF